MSIPPAPNRIDPAEYDRMWGVLDMTLSGHSLLRDRYRRRDTALVLLVLALSIVATGTAFLAGEHTVKIGPFSARLAVWLGILTSLIFFLTLFDLVVDWRQRAWAHEEAADRLGELKAGFRSVTRDGNVVETGSVDLTGEYQRAMDATIRIPERQFLRVKAAHQRKVAVSKLISSHPGAPLPYLRLLAYCKGLREQPADATPVEEPPV
jgi:hypothetical protein